MEKKVWVQYDKDGKHELNYTLKEDYNDNYQERVSLVRDAGEWSEDTKGTVAGSYVDDGNGVEIKLDGHKKITLDYSQVEALFILLHYSFQTPFYITEETKVSQFNIEDNA